MLRKVALFAFATCWVVGCSKTADPHVATQTQAAPQEQSATSSFPEIKDWNTVRIRLVREPCFGTCPVYSVEIRGDGTVTYCGDNFVKELGLKTRQISRAALEEVIAKFRDSKYFDLRDVYVGKVTDNATYFTSISFDNHAKSVIDYVGQMDGMPESVSRLENEIDAAAGKSDWIGSDAKGDADRELGRECPSVLPHSNDPTAQVIFPSK